MIKSPGLRPLLYLTVGWFGLQMALALDAAQFQVLLDAKFTAAGLQEWLLPLGPWHIRLGTASLIALVLSLGPLAGMSIQPLMGFWGDRLLSRGISRQAVMRVALACSLVGTVLFVFPLSLGWLIGAIAAFFISFNALMVQYRALVTETSNRRALAAHKGAASGMIALFSGLGSMCMFALSGILGNSGWPAGISALVLLLTFLLVFRFAPHSNSKRGEGPQPLPEGLTDVDALQGKRTPAEAGEGAQPLTSPWQLAFYACPLLSLIPAFEQKLVRVPEQRMIFRLFLTVFFSWLGIQALRIYFILFATKELHLSYSQGNLVLVVLTLMMLLAALPLGRLSDRISGQRLLMASLLVFLLACVGGWFFATSFPSAIVLGILLGLGFSGMIVLPLSMLFTLCPRQSEGRYSGLYNLFMSVPQLYSLFLTGWLVDATGSYRMILAVGAVCVAGAVLSCLRLRLPSPVGK